MSEKTNSAFAHDVQTAELNPVSQKKTGSKSINMTRVVVVAIVLFIITLTVLLNRNTRASSDGQGGQNPQPNTNQQQYQVQNQEVLVSTTWYNPNTQSLKIHVWGHPKPNVGNDILWQMRYNYNDATIVDMPPINGPEHKFVEFKGNIRAIEYRVTPGQQVEKVPFTFRFDPPK